MGHENELTEPTSHQHSRVFSASSVTQLMLTTYDPTLTPSIEGPADANARWDRAIVARWEAHRISLPK